MIGLLRKNVDVIIEDEFIKIRRAIWEISIPRNWVEAQPDFSSILERRKSANDISTGSEEFRNVLTLLQLHDCFYRIGKQNTYTLKEVKVLFDPICSEWYAKYYSHQLWQQLREGTLSDNGFIAWIIQNYHVSRAAGLTDARCATYVPRKELSRAFRESALEEYWHCDAFYFVHHPKFSITEEEVKTYVPLPSTLAFEQQMLHMAEYDWLGYTLVSYFQESSIRFYDDCRNFYREVEENYGLEGFFSSWMQHIELDFDHKHAENFSELFNSEESLSHKDVLRSIRNASHAFEFLMASLDEIQEQCQNEDRLLLRKPIQDGIINPEDTSLLKPYPLQNSTQLTSRNLLELYNLIDSVGINLPHPLRLPSDIYRARQDIDYLSDRIIAAAFKSLGYARGHDEVMYAGQLAERLSESNQNNDQIVRHPSLPAVAIANFIHECAISLGEFGFIIYHAYNLQKSLLRLEEQQASNYLIQLPFNKLSGEMLTSFLKSQCAFRERSNRLVNLTIQFNELFNMWLSPSKQYYDLDIF